MNALIAKKSTTIAAPASRVWAVLTRPDLTSEWSNLFGASGPIESDWKLGSDVLWKNADGVVYVSGRVTDAKPGRLLRFTVRSTEKDKQPLSGRPEDDITQTYALTETSGQTTLAIEHGDFRLLAGGEEIYSAVMTGWDTVLEKLKALAESA